MGYKVEMFDDWRLAVVLLFEEIDHAQLVTVANLQAAHPAFDRDCSQMVCILPGSNFNVTTDELRHYAAQQPIFSAQTSRAIVVTDNPLAFGFSRMFELTKDGSAGNVKVFSRFPEACDFLGLSMLRLIRRLPDLALYQAR